METNFGGTPTIGRLECPTFPLNFSIQNIIVKKKRASINVLGLSVSGPLTLLGGHLAGKKAKTKPHWHAPNFSFHPSIGLLKIIGPKFNFGGDFGPQFTKVLRKFWELFSHRRLKPG